jgi:hypothetical protein
MTEPEVQGQVDSEEYFNEGFATGQETAADDLREQIADTFTSAGFDPDEVDQLLYDPDPAPRKKHRRHRRHAKQYDPAPKKERKSKRVGKKVKGMLGKFKGYVFPVAAGGSFLMQYATRADTLKAAGSITTGGYAGILQAIQWDISHFNASDAMKRLSSNLSTVGVPLVGGYLVKNIGGGIVKSGVERDVLEIAGDLLIGYGVALGTKKILDPPIEIARKPQMQMMQRVQQPQMQMQTVQQRDTYIPWGY